MTTAVGYVRASTTDQEETIKAQQETIATYCTLRGLTLSHTYIDHGVSGTVPMQDRPQGAAMLRHLDSRTKDRPTAVVAVRLDRLFRNAADCLSNVQEWDRRGIALHLIDLGGQSIDTSSAAGRFFITVIAGAAEMERNLISERTAAVLRAKRSRGEVFNHAPYGYDRIGDRLIPNEGEQAILRRILTLRQGGASYTSIAATLNAEGIAGKAGGRWAAQTVKNVVLAASPA